VERFGGFVDGAVLPHAVYGYFNNGGSRCYVVSVKTIGKAQAGLLGTDGKPHLIVRAKQAGFDGLRLRVKVDAPKLPEAPPSKAPKPKGKEEEVRRRKQPASRKVLPGRFTSRSMWSARRQAAAGS